MMPLKARDTVSQDYSLMISIQASLDIKETQIRHQLSLIMVNDVLDIKAVSTEKVIGLISLLVSASWYWINLDQYFELIM